MNITILYIQVDLAALEARTPSLVLGRLSSSLSVELGGAGIDRCVCGGIGDLSGRDRLLPYRRRGYSSPRAGAALLPLRGSLKDPSQGVTAQLDLIFNTLSQGDNDPHRISRRRRLKAAHQAHRRRKIAGI